MLRCAVPAKQNRDFDIILQHQQHIYILILHFMDWNDNFYRVFNFLKSIKYFGYYALSNTESSLKTGTCGSRYREFDIMLQHQQLTFFIYVCNYFIDWSIVFNRMFNLLKPIK